MSFSELFANVSRAAKGRFVLVPLLHHVCTEVKPCFLLLFK